MECDCFGKKWWITVPHHSPQLKHLTDIKKDEHMVRNTGKHTNDKKMRLCYFPIIHRISFDK